MPPHRPKRLVSDYNSPFNLKANHKPFQPLNVAMALVNKLLSSSLPWPNFKHRSAVTPQPICSLRLNSSLSSSPFTEKHSVERYQRDQWVYANQFTSPSSSSENSEVVRENDIALQLPELKKLLGVLREKRTSERGEECGPGNVFLVGTGPGDPELLTLKAVRAIRSADLLLYDRLVSNDVLDLVGDDAKLLYVGKTAGYHSRTQVN